jgi:ATP-binding cassette subfamily B protein
MQLSSDSVPPKKNSPRSISGLIPFLKPYKIQISFAFVFLVLAAAATLAFPFALRQLVDQGFVGTDKTSQIMALKDHFLALFAVACALGIFSAARFYMVSWLGERVTADLRNAIYSHALEQSPEFFETTQTGEVLSRLSADTTLVQTVVGSSLSMGLRNAVMGIGALSILIWTHPLLMLQVFIGIVLVLLPTMWMGRRVRKLSRSSQDKIADSSAIAAEILNSIPVVQSYTAEERESQRFIHSTQEAFSTATQRSKARAFLVAFIIIATSAGMLWGLYQGTQAVMQGTMSAGLLGQTVVYVIILAGAFAVLGETYGDLLRAAGATERLMELLDAQSPIQSPVKPQKIVKPMAGSQIEFCDISFHYPSRPLTKALENFSLDVKAGETIALVGSSGAGKTTVFQLMLRFYDAQTGEIYIDGQSVKDVSLQELRKKIGIVPQDAVIFSSSALENIRYGLPNATDEEVFAAAKAAFADDFIRELPEGYQTFLGERGVRLSGGQKQRISIARAILKNPPLLLLDEATSALDAESERMVQAALETAMRGRTTLVIAHRLATIQKANRILVLEHGQIVEQGSHASLVELGGTYSRLAALQFDLKG